MAKNCIGVIEADAPLTSKPRFYLNKPTVKSLVEKNLVHYVAERLVRMVQSTVESLEGIAWWIDGKLGAGSVLCFIKSRNLGDKLHYEMPMAGDRTTFARHRRRQIRVSSRNLFARQVLV